MEKLFEIESEVICTKTVPDLKSGKRYVFWMEDGRPYCGNWECPVVDGEHIKVLYTKPKEFAVVKHIEFMESKVGHIREG